MQKEIEITDQNRHLVLKGKLCPYCGQKSNYINSIEIYGKYYGMLYICWPCRAYVGVHGGDTKNALGRLADAELRTWKKLAHSYFDPLWKKKVKQGTSKFKARSDAYTWLSQQLGIDRDYAHIGMLNVEQCQRLVELCKSLYKTKVV